MKTSIIWIFLLVSWSTIVDGKPTKALDKEVPMTKEELKNFLWEQLQKDLDSEDNPSRPFTAKQQAWFDSLAVRTPQLEAKLNLKTRREVRQLSDEEWIAYTDAVNALNTLYPDPDDDRTQYQLIAAAHKPRHSLAAHGGTAFVPWHREYLWRMERAVQLQNPDLAVPYWDTTLDSLLPDPKDTIIFSEHLFGNNDGQVTTGRFANYQVLPECLEADFTALYRNSSLNSLIVRKMLLFTEEKIEEALNGTHFANLSYNKSPLETYHGGPHVFIEGIMNQIPCSPSDPIFFSHHSFIDWLFQEFRETRQITPLETEYPTPEEVNVGGARHEAYADMRPFPGVYNIHGLSSHYTNYYYKFAKRHYTSCETSADCTSKYLWCDVTAGRCVSKIRANGRCTGLPDESCYGDNYTCVNDVCTENDVQQNLV